MPRQQVQADEIGQLGLPQVIKCRNVDIAVCSKIVVRQEVEVPRRVVIQPRVAAHTDNRWRSLQPLEPKKPYFLRYLRCVLLVGRWPPNTYYTMAPSPWNSHYRKLSQRDEREENPPNVGALGRGAYTSGARAKRRTHENQFPVYASPQGSEQNLLTEPNL